MSVLELVVAASLLPAGLVGSAASDASQQAIVLHRVANVPDENVPIEIEYADEISPDACRGKNWVFATFQTTVERPRFRLVIRVKVGRSWIFAYENQGTRGSMAVWIHGRCGTVLRMLADGVTRTRVTVVVTAPGYRETKRTVEIPVRY